MVLRDVVDAVFNAVFPLHEDADTGTHEESGTTGDESQGYGAKSPDCASYPAYLYDLS